MPYVASTTGSTNAFTTCGRQSESPSSDGHSRADAGASRCWGRRVGCLRKCPLPHPSFPRTYPSESAAAAARDKAASPPFNSVGFGSSQGTQRCISKVFTWLHS
ncbi:unnamed protein product, partial [Ixodes persulcatus]